MSLRSELWEAARANPEDDAPRLVLADWLVEQGAPGRAGFVRAQLERARRAPEAPEQVSLELAEWGYRRQGEAAWRSELPDLGPGVVWGRYERGFVRRVALPDPQGWIDHADALFRATLVDGVALPWVRMSAVPPLAAHPELRELTVYGSVIDLGDVQWLADSPILSTVRRLDLVASDIDAAGLRVLLTSPHLRNLERLRLAHHLIGDEGVEALIQLGPPGLVELELSTSTQDALGSGGRYQPTITPQGAIRLAEWPGLASVRKLTLTGQQIGVEGLQALLGSPHLAGLQRLHIRGISDWAWWDDAEGRADVLTAFAHAHHQLRLTALEIGECDLTEPGVAALVATPALERLQTLRVDLVRGSTPDAYAMLLGARWLDGLRILDASNIDDGPFWSGFFGADHPHLHTLRSETDFHWSRNAGIVDAIAGSPGLSGLRRLDLRDAYLADADLEALGRVDTLPALEVIELGNHSWYARESFGTDGARQFLGSPLGSRLTSASFFGRDLDVEDPGLDRLPRPGEPALNVGPRSMPEWPL